MAQSLTNERWGRQRVVVMEGDGLPILMAPAGGNPSLYDPTLCVMNFGWLDGTNNSVACTTTSQTAKFVRIVPQYAMSVTKVLSASGAKIV